MNKTPLLLLTLILILSTGVYAASTQQQVFGTSTSATVNYIGNSGQTPEIYNFTANSTYSVDTVQFYIAGKNTAGVAFNVSIWTVRSNNTPNYRVWTSNTTFPVGQANGYYNLSGNSTTITSGTTYFIAFEGQNSNADFYRLGETTGTINQTTMRWCASFNFNASLCNQYNYFTSNFTGLNIALFGTSLTSPILTLQVNNSVNGSLLPFCANFTTTNTSNASFVSCSTNGSGVTTNYSFSNGNITFYDIGSGDGNPSNGIYFNQTLLNYNFNSTGSKTVSTFQSLINVSSYRLFTNSSISQFTVTNGLYVNSTPSASYTLVPANNGSNNIKVDVTGNFSQNYTCNTSIIYQTINCNATNIFDDLFTINATSITGTAVNTFTINLTNLTLGGLLYRIATTNGTIQFPTLQGYYYYFTIEPVGYAFSNATLAANNSGNNFTFTLYTSNIVNFTFYSETNLSTVAGPNITLNLVSTPQSAVYTTINGTITSSVLTPASYVATYSSTNFTTRNYQFTLVNGTIMSVRLPMLVTSGATTVTITVADKTGSLLSNATVKAYLYDITTNSYILNQVGVSNSQGILTMTMQLNGPNYYFTVDYQGSTRLVTVPSQIYSSSLSLSVPLSTQAFSTIIANINLQGSIVNTTPYGLYTFTWTDSDNTASQGCLYAFQFQGLGKQSTLYNFTCAATSSGSVNTGINNASNISYYLYGIVTKGGVDYTLDTKLITPNQSSVSEAQSPIWLFVMLLVIVVMASIFRKSPAMAVFIVGLVPVLFSSAGLIAIPLAYTTPMFVIALVIAVVIGQPWK